jgi:alkanesulfonate monooxygenase SsuD/methylene tetrahydromethanopterin reductase-like flavin-dependent oxidoreductase (luciferase family)
MEIGIGLPNVIRGVSGIRLLEWAQAAEAEGFSSLAALDRVVYPNFEPMVTLAGAAGATHRIGLFANVVLAPTRDTALLAKEAASVDQLSGGRFRLGLGVGRRQDDFEITGRDFGDRGARFDDMLDVFRRTWRGEKVLGGAQLLTPPPAREPGVPVVIGGQTEAAINRVVRFGVGWTSGGSGTAEDVGRFGERVRIAWANAGRSSVPKIIALAYFSVGEEARSRQQIEDYYSFRPSVATRVSEQTPRSRAAIRSTVVDFEKAGVDELFFIPTVADLDQVRELATLAL